MKNKNKRTIIQLIAAAFTNGYIFGFLQNKIYTGNTKVMCVPGLNCYSCPGAVGSCPIGALQAVLNGRDRNFSYYVFGIIMLFGVIFGRLICGFLCPFGLIQDLLHKIPISKINVPKCIDRPLRYLKYVIAVLFVILMPIFLVNQFGIGSPYFCKLICPVGTLEGGIQLVSTNEILRSQVGFLFSWKMGILIAVVVLSIIIYRPFCKYICPLGAFYGLFNKFSFYQMEVDTKKCTGCKACERQCKMNVEILKNINSAECIRCGECKDACAFDAIKSGYKAFGKEKK